MNKEHATTGEHVEPGLKTFGFWIYIMSDCLLFATLFAVYAVFHSRTFGGPTPNDLFSLPFVLGETMILLTSSFVCGLALLSAREGRAAHSLFLFIITLILGTTFVALEISEFSKLVEEGHGPSTSAFLSSFFTLVGTHGLHVTLGSLWLVTLIIQTMMRGLTAGIIEKLSCFALFWHFLDIIWIFIFTFVYLFGAA
jgi:cytochrome o ubiquinol oxidase subunit III